MEADYRQEEGHITITYDEPRTHTHKQTSFDMILSSESSTPSIWTRMYYTCLPPHSCDRKLVNKWIRWIIDINSQVSQLTSSVLSEKAVDSYECKIWSHTVDHLVDVCFTYKYKKIDGTSADAQNNANTPLVSEHESDRTSVSRSLQNLCSRLEERKTQVYNYVLSEIPHRCTPKALVSEPETVSSSTKEHPSNEQNDRLREAKLFKFNPKTKSDEINESTTTTTVEPGIIGHLREIP